MESMMVSGSLFLSLRLTATLGSPQRVRTAREDRPTSTNLDLLSVSSRPSQAMVCLSGKLLYSTLVNTPPQAFFGRKKTPALWGH